jgi:hypothetical protein
MIVLHDSSLLFESPVELASAAGWKRPSSDQKEEKEGCFLWQHSGGTEKRAGNSDRWMLVKHSRLLPLLASFLLGTPTLPISNPLYQRTALLSNWCLSDAHPTQTRTHTQAANTALRVGTNQYIIKHFDSELYTGIAAVADRPPLLGDPLASRQTL